MNDFDRLHEKATELWERIRPLDRAHAILEITSALIDHSAAVQMEVMDAVENKLLHQEHH